MTMDERKQRVLSAVVSLYSAEGEPVGSSLLRDYLDMAVSTATLRNEMAALTRLGLLEQPHTSAGRVPSMAGYRYYIRSLLDDPGKKPRISPKEKKAADEAFENFDYDPERLAKGVAKELAHETGFTAVVTTPKSEDVKIAYFNVLQVGRCSAAVLSVSSVGGVATRVAMTEKPLHPEEIRRVSETINRNLCFVSKDDADSELQTRLEQSLGGDGNCRPVLTAAMRLLQGAGRGKVCVEGVQNLLSYSEMEPILHGCLDLLNRPDDLLKLISPRNDQPMVLFGDDMPGYRLPGAAIVSRRYLAGGGLTGAIALLGPARMRYTSVMPLLEYFADKLCCTITGTNKED